MNSSDNNHDQQSFPQRELQLVVNGKAVTVSIAAQMTLAELLRDRLGLKGTKVACNQAACGSCTVLQRAESQTLQAIFACHTLAWQMQGAELVTIESLAGNGTLDPLQQAFIEHDALQCGFCTPGMVMALKAVLASYSPDQPPQRDDIARAISGNICRCGAYQQILDAAVDVISQNQHD